MKLNLTSDIYCMCWITTKDRSFLHLQGFFLSNLQFRYNSSIVFGPMNQMPTKMHRDCMEAGWLIYVRRSQLLEGLPQSLGRNVLDHINDRCYFWFEIWYSNTWVVQLIGIIYLWAKFGNFCTLIVWNCFILRVRITRIFQACLCRQPEGPMDFPRRASFSDKQCLLNTLVLDTHITKIETLIICIESWVKHYKVNGH